MSDKRIRALGAGLTTDEWNRSAGTVELRVIALWLRGEPVVTGEMTAREARQLAIQLLKAAESLA